MKVLLKTGRVLPLMLALLISLLGLIGEGIGVAYAATQTVTVCDQAHLNAAITAAAPGDTVNFSCSGTISLTSTLTISKNLTLDGSGQSVILDGQNTVQVLFVNTGITFTLNALTITKGSVGPGSFGGGLENNSGTVHINNSNFVNNSGRSDGGGLDSEFGGTMTISNSTIATNSSGGNGGGLWNDGTVTITNSTFANNSASGGGGGITNFGTVTITNSTIANNSAPTGNGGGLLNGGTTNITQSMVANNPGGDCAVPIPLTDGGYNLDSDGTCGFTTANHDLPHTNPQLDPAGLASNGGPTETIALLSSSPAIDFIPAPSVCKLTSDQRGFPRPDNGESVCDIGAFEFQDPPAPPPPSSSTPSVPASAVCDISTTKPGTFCLNQGGSFATSDIS